MKNLIVANWKMNPASKKEACDLGDSVFGGENVEVVICPPFIYLPLIKRPTLGAPASPSLGGQNVFYEEKGAFTGEISALMLKDLGVEYVIIGHSERRKYFGESDEIINKKIKKSLEAGLKVIFCIGETQEEHDAGQKNEILERQIKIGLAGIEKLKNLKIEKLAIAYEPVWAIGTGNNCSVEETKESINFIREFVKSDFTRILYGGSVKSNNSGDYIKKAGANGLLVGGASLNAEEFVKIVKSAE